MYVRISDISPTGLLIKENLSLESLNKRLKSNSREDDEILFTEAPYVQIRVLKTSFGAETKGSVRAKFTQSCSLCLLKIERMIEIPADFILREKRFDKSGKPLEDYEDDVGVFHYVGDTVNIEEIIQESLILSLNLFWHPPIDESGNCTHCKLSMSTPNPTAEKSEKKGALGSLLEVALTQGKK